MPASHGCSPPFILAGFIQSRRISDPLRHALSFLLCLYCFVDWLPRFLKSTPLLPACVCVCVVEKERSTRWLYLRYSSPCVETPLKGLKNKPLLVCLLFCDDSLCNLLSGREWRSVPLLQWRRGCCFFSGPETARYARWCNTYKGVCLCLFLRGILTVKALFLNLNVLHRVFFFFIFYI